MIAGVALRMKPNLFPHMETGGKASPNEESLDDH